MFQEVSPRVSFPSLEKEVLGFWDERRIYEQSLANRAGRPTFVFFEGPPTANGLPHPGHLLTRVVKDIFPRYRTMRGFRCERKAGWDTHGLPVEVEVGKHNDPPLLSKQDIENFGVEPFIHKCIDSVFKYTKEWEDVTRRLGFWVNLGEAYVTYHQSYIESVWWALKTLYDRGLLYQGHKVVWWWAQGGTALSSGEVGEGYRDTDDPSIVVRFKVNEGAALESRGWHVPSCPKDNAGRGPRVLPRPADSQSESLGRATQNLEVEGAQGAVPLSILAWTTTPWTLPSNVALAVGAEVDYVVLEHKTETEHERFLLAEALVEKTFAGLKIDVQSDLKVLGKLKGAELVGVKYEPILKYGAPEFPFVGKKVWEVAAADFVTLDAGTGVVHVAPAFGEDDYRFAKENGFGFLQLVAPDGKFKSEVTDFAGRFCKEADKDIIAHLKERGVLLKRDVYRHQYPFCPRAENDPLIQYARQSWFIRTSEFKSDLLANNAQMNWLPDHIEEGRFGDFLRNNVDWALSRERFWGTPLPIWKCSVTGKMEAVASYDELLAKPDVKGTEVWDAAKAKNPNLSEHLKIHKPYIDSVSYASPFDGAGRMERVPEVIDCWFDSGAMPFAQWGFPHRNREKFAEQYPADFISEAIDQTRGWFYSLTAISTLLGKEMTALVNRPAEWPLPFRTCIVLGFILGEDGKKLSKRLRNYKEAGYLFDTYGADALRWYLLSAQPPTSTVRFQESAIQEAQREFLIRLHNVVSFFTIYANIDGFDPMKTEKPKAGEWSSLDRWIAGELASTVAFVTQKLDAFDNYAAAGRINEFVDALSNWYVRRSRERFWGGGLTPDKRAAYWTLYDCLTTLVKLLAPYTPFYADWVYRNLVHSVDPHTPESVHLCDWPEANASAVDETLAAEMALVREIVSVGRSARTAAKLKVRQPLSAVKVLLADHRLDSAVGKYTALVADELNVKAVELAADANAYVTFEVKPNLKALGPKLGKKLPLLSKALAAADPAALRQQIVDAGSAPLQVGDETVALTADDVMIQLAAKPGYAAGAGKQAVVVLATEVTPELRLEGLARELVHHVNGLRKEAGLAFDDRIELAVEATGEVADAVSAHADYLKSETLATAIVKALPGEVHSAEVEVEGTAVRIALRKV